MDIGAKYHSPNFARVIEGIGAYLVDLHSGHRICCAALPVLLIKPDLSLLHPLLPWPHMLAASTGARGFVCRYDSGTIGEMWKTQRPPMLLLGFATSGPRGNTITTFADALPHGDRATGSTTAADLIGKLTGRGGQQPYSMRRQDLRKRLAVVQVDGAHTHGGPASKHTTTASAEKLLCDLGLRECWASWDEFHKLDAAGRKALNGVPLAKEFFDVVKQIGHKFAIGSGVQLDRGLSSALETRHLVTKTGAGTRKIVCPEESMRDGGQHCGPVLQCLPFGI